MLNLIMFNAFLVTQSVSQRCNLYFNILKIKPSTYNFIKLRICFFVFEYLLQYYFSPWSRFREVLYCIMFLLLPITHRFDVLWFVFSACLHFSTSCRKSFSTHILFLIRWIMLPWTSSCSFSFILLYVKEVHCYIVTP